MVEKLFTLLVIKFLRNFYIYSSKNYMWLSLVSLL